MFKSSLVQSLSALTNKSPHIYFSVLLFCIFSLFPAFKLQAQTPGSLDPTFSGDGIAYLGFPIFGGYEARAYAGSVIQADNKVVTAGYVKKFLPPDGSTEVFGILRFNADGTLDESFGNSGEVTLNLGQSEQGTALAIQPDGKILFAGICDYYPYFESILMRFNSNGTLDSTFNNTGILRSRVGIGEGIADIIIQPDGKIVTVGWTATNGVPNEHFHALISRRNPDGSLDSSFNNTGRSTVSFPGDGVYTSGGVLQPDGKIVLVGITYDYYLAATRVNPDGSLDTSFGDGGRAIIPQIGRVIMTNAALQTDNKIVVAGRNHLSDPRDFLLARIAANGTLDTTFGENGLVRTDFGSTIEQANDVVIQANGKILAAGYTTNPQSSYNFAVARYNVNGSLDTSFGTNGKVTTDFGLNYADEAYSIGLQRDGKIVVGGTGGGQFGVARYFGDKPPVFDFDGDGKTDVSIFRPNAAEWYWLGSANNQSSGQQFGINSDKTVPADYDGDGKTDISVFRNGDWYRLNSSDNQFVGVHFGQSGDKPVPSDFDGDGKADLAVYRAGNWYILNSSNDSFRAEQFGISSDKPITGADFDGDGKSDLAVYREGVWYAMRSRDGFFGAQFGVTSDKPVAADYDGDGKTDLAVYRPADGVWYLQRSSLGFTATQFGIASDKPVPADYDGDGKTDLAVYRAGDWYLLQSSAGFRTLQFGTADDQPLPNTFVP
jgi:uncharacterized delta-60 repeat protein